MAWPPPRTDSRSAIAVVAPTVATLAFLVAVVVTADVPVAFSVMGVAFLAQGVLVSLSLVVIALLRAPAAAGAEDPTWTGWWTAGVFHPRWREFPRRILVVLGLFTALLFAVDAWHGVAGDMERSPSLQGAALGAAILAAFQLARRR